MKNKQVLLGCTALLALAVVFAAVYYYGAKKPTEGQKSISVTVVHGDQTTRTVEFETAADYLRQALEEQSLISGEESSYGLFVKTADGETVNEDAQQWWNFTQEGQKLETGVDTTPVTDGAGYEITLMTGYGS